MKETTVGYTGGHEESPSYPLVCSGSTGHAEAVQVLYDPKQISYRKLLEEFFKLHKPVFDQKSVKGGQYRSSIFFETKEEEAIARSVKAQFEKEKMQKLFTEIVPGREFHPAEEYHQDYYKKNNLL